MTSSFSSYICQKLYSGLSLINSFNNDKEVEVFTQGGGSQHGSECVCRVKTLQSYTEHR